MVLAPSSRWVVDYADSKCRLARSFGTSDETALLFMEQGSPGSRFSLTVAGPQFKRFSDDRAIDLSLNETHKPIQTRPFTGNLDKTGPALIYSNLDLDSANRPDGHKEKEEGRQAGLPSIDTATAANARFFHFEQGNRVVRLNTGVMKAPVEALNACSADLVRSWGLDLDRHRDARRLPVWTNRDAIVKRIVSKYPGTALRTGEQGILKMRVMIDDAGNVTGCELERATSAEAIESPACKEMQNAQFEAALDRDGKPMNSYYATTIIYRMAR